MQVWMLLGGIVIVAAAVVDALSTTLAASSAAGPITARVGGGCWRLLRRLAGGPESPVMAVAGPATVLVTVGAWLLLLWLGWTLVLASHPDAIVASATGTPAGWWARAYFAAYSLFTLGLGDYIPAGAPWQIATSLALINGLGLTTLAITYLIPVVSAVTERRQQASTIAALGQDAQSIVLNAWDGSTLRFLDQHLLLISQEILRTAQRHLSYPILHFYHSRSRSQEFAVSVAALDEALTMIEHATDEAVRPHRAAIRMARNAIRELLAIIESTFHEPADQTPPPPDLAPLRSAGIPLVTDPEFAARIDELDDHRSRLLAFVVGSTWPWDAAVTVRGGGA